MSFSAKQIRLLRKQPHPRHLRSRQGNGRELTYIEGWHAIDEANRIFGFDGWDRETVDSRCVFARESSGVYRVLYAAKVRITVRADRVSIVREGSGTSEARGPSSAEAHDMALKSAETDATKRALATFGRPFGLALHLHPKSLETSKVASHASPDTRTAFDRSSRHATAQSEHGPMPSAFSSLPPPKETIKLGAAPKSTPLAVSSLAPKESQAKSPQLPVSKTEDPGSAPAASISAVTSTATQSAASEAAIKSLSSALDLDQAPIRDDGRTQIDKSLLTHGSPRRYRDKKHLKFVAAHPCLVCSRQPSDAHHLRFAQFPALGRKVSDHFTVPLCRLHHRELHQAGKEQDWWETQGIDPLPIAADLWSESRLSRLGKRGSSLLGRIEQ
jgi:DNA recombination protein Rad52